MALPDITELTVTELEALVAACEKQITRRQKAKKAELAKQFRALAKSEGLDVDEIMAAKPKAETAPKTKRKASKKKRAKVAPKYRNPDNASQTWTGRGRKPKWVEEALEAGKSLDDIAIND